MDEVYIQTCSREDSSAWGIVGIDQQEGFDMHLYILRGLSAVPDRTLRFEGRDRSENYRRFQEEVKRITGADAVPFNPDTDIINGIFSRALEKAISEHISLS